ncbi:MAG: hypothetical protein AAGD14_14020 [Planctomycetota bacterium]
MRARFLLLGAVLLAVLVTGGCQTVTFDVWRAKVGEDTADIFRGKDRGYFGYRKIIQDYTVKAPNTRRYQYTQPQHVANYQVRRAVRGLGGTEWTRAEAIAVSVDRLLYVLRHDPTPSVRVEAVSQLGRIAERLKVDAVDPYPLSPLADEAIRQAATDLFELQQRIDGGERIAQSIVVKSLEQFREAYPTRFQTAMAMTRALASKPILLVPPGPVLDASTALTPTLCRRAISIALSQVACGSVLHAKVRADEAYQVRLRAFEVLTALRDPVARDVTAAAIGDPIYPNEQEGAVRSAALVYLGVVGGAIAFDTAVLLLDNDYVSQRMHAHAALLAMTGERLPADAEAWRRWKRENPDWFKAAR